MSFVADLSGERALITGASSGLGMQFARVLSASGAHVILAARRRASIDALEREITRAGGSATCVTMDVTDAASVDAAVEAAGSVSILVNNAGIAATAPLLETPLSDFDSIIQTNLRGAYLVGIAVARAMVAQGGGGNIINVASILGLRQAGHVTPYAVSKAAVIQLTKQMSLELGQHNIRVNALAPGYVVTDLNRDFLEGSGGTEITRRIPMRRFGTLEDVSGPLLFLASSAARFVSGSVLTVDGGHAVSKL